MKKFFDEFKKFAMRGNVVDMAVGVVVGGAFGKIVTSLVNDVFMPVIGLLTGGKNVSGMFALLGKAPEGVVIETIDQAKELGIALTAADFEESNEISDDDLDAVSGGSDVSCACAMGGGGEKDTNDKTCACVLAGVGYEKDGSERCLCGFAGYGYDT